MTSPQGKYFQQLRIELFFALFEQTFWDMLIYGINLKLEIIDHFLRKIMKLNEVKILNKKPKGLWQIVWS